MECPSCGKPMVAVNVGRYYRCTNLACPRYSYATSLKEIEVTEDA